LSNGKVEDIDNSIKKSILAALLTVVFLDNLGFAILLPYLYYYVAFLGGSVFDYGLLLATYSLMSFIFTPVISRLSDRYGRRRVLLAAVMISSISYFVVGIGQFLWILFLGRMLAGTTAATYPISQAYMVDVTSKESRLRYIGYLGASAGIAFIIGPLIGGTLSSIAGFSIPAFLASALAATNLILAFLFLPEPTMSHSDLSARAVTIKALRKVLRKRSIQMLLGTYFLFFLAFMFLQTTLTPWLEGIFGFSEFETGLVFFYVGLMVAFAQVVLLPRLSTKLNKMELTIYGWLMLFGGFLTMGIFGSLHLFLVIVGLVAVGSGLMLVTIVTLISLNAPREAQGGTLGLAQSLSGLAQTIAPTIATAIFSFSVTINITGLVFIAAAIISACIAPLILKLKNQPENNTFTK
jgi:DHA1 family tetracycline resistance protein-like MFS transporter